MATLYQSLFWPMLKRTDPEDAHERTLAALELAQRIPFGPLFLKSIRGRIPNEPVEAFGLQFPNALGVAAGFDKDVRVVSGLGMLGFGHVEVGTITPLPQPGNDRPRIHRLPLDGAAMNSMGFPSHGITDAIPRLQKFAQMRVRPVIGVSPGKQKVTPLDQAAEDYVAVMRHSYPYADYFAANISSPNTPALRDLQEPAFISSFLRRLQEATTELAAFHKIPLRPVLVKISPDVDDAGLDAILQAAIDHNIAGIIATNTTISRAGLRDPNRTAPGGVSGLPLRSLCNDVIRKIVVRSGLPVIGVGGVRSAADAKAKFDAGATLVQLYTGMVYEGPGIAGRILRRMRN